jgi:hypothetical protein
VAWIFYKAVKFFYLSFQKFLNAEHKDKTYGEFFI